MYLVFWINYRVRIIQARITVVDREVIGRDRSKSPKLTYLIVG